MKPTELRNKIIGFFYQHLLKPVYFSMDPEFVHDRFLKVGGLLGSNPATRGLARLMFGYRNPKLEQNILGINFSNPIGLAAGFDKNAMLTKVLPNVGFGFMEIGSVTGEPCPGNIKPRLWRLPKSRSLVVYYGLANLGCEKISKKLLGKKFVFPVGTNVAKTNSAATDDIEAGIKDYAKAFKSFSGIGSYFTVNISCPNTSGGEPFLEPANLERLLTVLDKIPTSKPIFVKLHPDLATSQLDGLIEVVLKHRVHGLICTNLTVNRKSPKILDSNVPPKGGMSGKVVEELSNEMIRHVYQKTQGRLVIIGCGGVFTAEDAYKKIKLGANLVQMITGMIFQGPQTVSSINSGLARLLEHDGLSNISQAVGMENKVKVLS